MRGLNPFRDQVSSVRLSDRSQLRRKLSSVMGIYRLLSTLLSFRTRATGHNLTGGALNRGYEVKKGKYDVANAVHFFKQPAPMAAHLERHQIPTMHEYCCYRFSAYSKTRMGSSQRFTAELIVHIVCTSRKCPYFEEHEIIGKCL